MNYHPTPTHITNILRRHLPRHPKSILEPAAGEGALLNSLAPETLCQSKITIIDIDKVKCNLLGSKFKNQVVINTDFIKWSRNNPRKEYDLILTNPPFSGRTECWIEFERSRVPLEIAFMKLALRHLSKQGTLLAIVPDSVVRSSRWKELRKTIFVNYSVNYAYQLPEKTFKRIEGVFFLLAITRRKNSKLTEFRKIHYGEESLTIDNHTLEINDYRLDYDYYKAAFALDVLGRRMKTWLSPILGVFQSSIRGRIRSEYTAKGRIHTSHFDNLSYDFRLPSKGHYFSAPDDYCVVVKRVSRDAHLSFGLMSKRNVNRCTDCLIIVISDIYEPIQLLFYLRTIFANDLGKSILLKGAGAKYISVVELCELPFYELHTLNKQMFREYENYLLRGEVKHCLDIEQNMFSYLLYGDKVHTFPINKSKRKNDCQSEQMAMETLIG